MREIQSCKCACGCGETVRYERLCPAFLKARGPRRYIQGHQNRGRHLSAAHKRKVARPMELNGRWKGGVFVDRDGYVLRKAPGHPAARKAGYVLEHRLVMEARIGRYLRAGEVVHHKNSKRHDNRPENLVLTNPVEHMKIERTGKKYPRKNGVWRQCQRCEKRYYLSASAGKIPGAFCSWACRYPAS